MVCETQWATLLTWAIMCNLFSREELGISTAEVTVLANGGIATFSQCAFCCAYQPGAQSDGPLFDHLELVLGTRPAGAEASAYRRLFFECHAMALKDLQSRLERSDTSEVKILPLAEKVQRLDALRRQFPGVMLSPSLEPSHVLIDKAVRQAEENCVRLIELTSCTSREQEIKNEKTTAQLSFDTKGAIKVTKQSEVTECSIQGDIRLRGAFTRRSLAYALAGIASFEVLEGWTQLLFDRVCQDPPAGYKHISIEQIEQIVTADRHFWVKISEKTRSKLHTTIDGDKALDVAINELSHHPEIQFHMLPLPVYGAVGGSSVIDPRPTPYSGDGGKGKSKEKGKGKEKGGGKGKIVAPSGCSIKFGENGKPICMKWKCGSLPGQHQGWKEMRPRIPRLLERQLQQTMCIPRVHTQSLTWATWVEVSRSSLIFMWSSLQDQLAFRAKFAKLVLGS